MAETETRITALENNVSDLQKWQTEQRVNQAVEEEKRTHIDDQFGRVNSRLDKMDGHMTWIVRLFVGGLIVGIIGFALKGGFNVG